MKNCLCTTLKFSDLRWRIKTSKPFIITTFPLLAVSLIVSGCGGGSSGSTPEPDPIVNTTSTEDLTSNAATNIGGSLDAALNGVSQVTSGGDSSGDVFAENPADTGIGGLWNDDAQSLINTSLDLGNDENTVREGTRITIDPDDAAICSENLVDMGTNQTEFQRCQALVSDMLVQIDATSDTAGTMTYLFQNQPLAVVGYTSDTNSFELNLGTLKSLIDADNALNPDNSDESPLDTIQGAVRMSASATNQTTGAENGTVALEVSQPISIASADAGDTLSLGTGTLLAMSADAANGTASIELAIGALQTSTNNDGVVDTLDLAGLTAIIDLDNNSDQLTVRNLGIGQGPLLIQADNSDVINLGLETFGFNVAMGSEDITLTGALDLNLMLGEMFGDNTTSDTLFSLLEITAPNGTQLSEQLNGSLMVASGGPLSYSLTTLDDNGNQVANQLTVNAGQCADDTGDGQQLVSCQ